MTPDSYRILTKKIPLANGHVKAVLDGVEKPLTWFQMVLAFVIGKGPVFIKFNNKAKFYTHCPQCLNLD